MLTKTFMLRRNEDRYLTKEKISRRHPNGLAATFAVFAGLLSVLPTAVQASSLEQFKSFVATTKSAKGEFSQRLVKSENAGPAKISNASTGTFMFARPGK